MADETVVLLAGDASGEDALQAPPRNWRRNHLWAAVLLSSIALSVFVFARIASSPTLLSGIRETLDQQQLTVSGLAAGATALSAGLSLVPQGALEPIANQLADVSGWFVVIIAAIVLQKILVTVAGPAAFVLIIPLACVLGIIYVYSRRIGLRSLAIRFAAFGLVLCFAVPGSIFASSALTSTYASLSTPGVPEVVLEDESGNDPAIEGPGAPVDDREESLLESIGGWFSDAATNVGGAIGRALTSLNEIKDAAVGALNSYMESFALLIVTTCVMPLLVMLLAWVIKMLFSIDLGVDRAGRALQAKASRGSRAIARSASRAKG